MKTTKTHIYIKKTCNIQVFFSAPIHLFTLFITIILQIQIYQYFILKLLIIFGFCYIFTLYEIGATNEAKY